MKDQILKLLLAHLLENREMYLKMLYDTVMQLVRGIDADKDGKPDVDEFLVDFHEAMPIVERVSNKLDALKKMYLPKK